jgi:hypothetical protein
MWGPAQVEYQRIPNNFTHADGKTSSALEGSIRQPPFNMSVSNQTTRVDRRRGTYSIRARSAHVGNRRVVGRTQRIRQFLPRAATRRIQVAGHEGGKDGDACAPSPSIVQYSCAMNAAISPNSFPKFQPLRQRSREYGPGSAYASFAARPSPSGRPSSVR